MSITLQRFSSGDTNYIAKHNQNAGDIENAVASLESQVLAAAGAAVSAGSAFESLFGDQAAVVGKASYVPTPSGTSLNVAPGYFWRPSTGTLVLTAGTTVLPFTGVAADTYYLQVDATGTVTRSNEVSEAVYSVVWTGSAFGTITRLAKIIFGAQDWIDAQDSDALGATYDALDDRLEAGETKAVAGDLSRTYDLGQLAKSVAGSANVALTAIEANNAILRFTGALTGDIDVSVTLPAPRIWLVRNDTTGSFTLTLKGASGTGEVVPQGSVAWAYHDGTNVYVMDVVTGGALGTAATLDFDTDGTLVANSDAKIPTQKAVRTYVGALLAAQDALVFKGVINCSANPNYPAADAGHVYKVSVAGKIGGSSGPSVEINDTIYCISDSSAAGNHATVGANWAIVQGNLDGVVIGPASSIDNHVAVFDGVTGKLLKDSGLLLSGSNTGDQTDIAGNAGTATALQTPRNIDGQAFNGTADITVIAPATHAATSKATPVDADEVPLVDSAASNVLKKLTWANLKATLKSYFDGFYVVGSGISTGTNTGDQTIALTGDVTGSGTGSFAATIANDAVTYAKMQNVSATKRILGRKTTGTGDTEECSLSDILDFIGSVTQGDILYRDSAAWARLPAGTAGQVLKTAGTGANPSWTDAVHTIAAFYPGIPTSSAKVLYIPITESITFAANFSGSYFKASANATGSAVFDVQKNGSSIGSVTIGAGGTTATFATSGGTAKTLVAGDLLAIIAPATADATLADPSFALRATRS